jgi:hypothetical protein
VCVCVCVVGSGPRGPLPGQDAVSSRAR